VTVLKPGKLYTLVEGWETSVLYGRSEETFPEHVFRPGVVMMFLKREFSEKVDLFSYDFLVGSNIKKFQLVFTPSHLTYEKFMSTVFREYKNVKA
jgi:hypothetical protein